jgi:hypothetical protein
VKYEDTLNIEDKPIQITTMNMITIMVLGFFPWVIGMFTIFDYFFRWNT